MTPEKRSALIGYLALAVTVLIWSAWIVYTRQGMQHALPIPVIAFVRMLVPAVILVTVTMVGRDTAPMGICAHQSCEIRPFVCPVGSRLDNSDPARALNVSPESVVIDVIERVVFPPSVSFPTTAMR